MKILRTEMKSYFYSFQVSIVDVIMIMFYLLPRSRFYFFKKDLSEEAETIMSVKITFCHLSLHRKNWEGLRKKNIETQLKKWKSPYSLPCIVILYNSLIHLAPILAVEEDG